MAEPRAEHSPLLAELLAKAKAGTTVEQVLIERAEQAKLNAAAARGIVAGINPGDIGDDIHAGLEHVLDRAFHAAADIEEVLSDGVKLAGREAGHG